MNNPNLYIPPSNKVPAWIGWILGVGFVGIILASGTVVLKHVSPAQAAGSVAAAAPVVAPSAAPVAAAAAVADEDAKDDAAPAVAVAAAADAPVAAAPRAKKAKGKHGGKAVKIARASKSKATKGGARHYTQQRSAKILAKHDNNSTRQSKQKLDRLLGL